MDKVQINRHKLLEAINTNLQKHIEEYNQARVDYIKYCSKQFSIYSKNFRSSLARYENGEYVRFSTFYVPPEPISHEKDYLKAINMIEFSTQDIIEITSKEFSNFILDEWDWKNSFSETASGYKLNYVK